MPVEIRELVIRTTIVSPQGAKSDMLKPQDLAALKQQIVQECLRVLKEKDSKNSFNR